MLGLAVSSITLSCFAVAQCSIPPLTLTWSNVTVTQDGLGVTRGIELGIGTPHQIFSLRPSTTFNNTQINNVLNCGTASNNSCVGGLGGVFDSSRPDSYIVSIKSQWNGSQVDEEDSTAAYVYFNDRVGFQKNGQVEGFPLVMSSEEWGGVQSGLPLGTNSSFLRAAVSGKVAPSQVFGLWGGSRGINPRDGLVVVGGYDRARVEAGSDFTTFPIGQWSLKRACPLQVTIANLTYAGLPLIPNNNDELVVCIEPSTQRFVFPPSVANTFAIYTGQNETMHPGKMRYNVASRPTGDLTVTLSNGYQSTISNEELFAPLRGSDENGRYAIINESIVEASVADTRKHNPSDIDSILGGLFLTFNYLLVDYENSEFKLAPAVTADTDKVPPDLTVVCTPTVSPAPFTPTSMAVVSSTNIGATVGGVVGGAAGLALLGILAFMIIKRKRRARDKNSAVSTNATDVRLPLEQIPKQLPELYAHGASSVHELPTSRCVSVREPEVRQG
jgi:hypothetical protein